MSSRSLLSKGPSSSSPMVFTGDPPSMRLNAGTTMNLFGRDRNLSLDASLNSPLTQHGSVICLPTPSLNITEGWLWAMTRVSQSMTSGEGHVCPWISPTSSIFIPVAGRMFTLLGRNSSIPVSWFPLTTSMMSKRSDNSSKKSGISAYSCLVDPGTESFTSPMTTRRFAPSPAASRIASIILRVWETRWNPFLRRWDSTPMWRSPITRVHPTIRAGMP